MLRATKTVSALAARILGLLRIINLSLYTTGGCLDSKLYACIRVAHVDAPIVRRNTAIVFKRGYYAKISANALIGTR